VIGGVQVSLRHFLRQVASKFARATGLPTIVANEGESVLGQTPSSKAEASPDDADRDASALPSLSQALRRHAAGAPHPSLLSQPEDLGRPTDMNASVETLADQMLTLVEIVSAQEKDIKALKEQCRKLEEHDQAIAVAFSTFFHVLAAGRVAKLGEIAGILNHITLIAEQEGRPPESIKFLRELAAMLPDDQR